MNASKQNTWVNSMFSQILHPDANKSTKRKKYEDTIAKPNKRIKKKQPSDDAIVVEAKEIFDGASMTKLKTSTFTKETSNTEILDKNWIDVYAPNNSDELAIHPKKLLELQQWFDYCADMKSKKCPAQLCLLTGPPGCGKTSAVRVLAKENKTSIQEWINPVDQEIIHNLGDQGSGQSFMCSQIESFKNFLFKASRYRSLLEINAANKSLLMVEDFPNFLFKDSTIFQDLLEDYVNYAKSPLIFIVTDSKSRSLNISYNIFTDQIRQKFHITHISFNSVATTIMKKSMKRFCSLMCSPMYCQIYKSPSQDVIDSIVISAQGDVRNALINLHFSSLINGPNILNRHRSSDKEKNAKKGKGKHATNSLGRDESITMMHALGRVFNPKFTEHQRFVHSPEELAEAFTTEPRKFIDLIEGNYIPHFQDIEYLLEAADGLSICDVILNEYRDDSLALAALNVGIRSVMVSNKNPEKGWMPIRGHRRLDLNKAIMLPKENNVLPPYHNISSSVYTLDYKTFVNIISP